eukprot:scaffold452742_cov19-Prasinocladus_malaysianus.AAC.1
MGIAIQPGSSKASYTRDPWAECPTVVAIPLATPVNATSNSAPAGQPTHAVYAGQVDQDHPHLPRALLECGDMEANPGPVFPEAP